MHEATNSESTMDTLGMGFSKWSKTALIQDLQISQGHERCFRTQKSTQCAEECQWRRDCCRLVAEWLREW